MSHWLGYRGFSVITGENEPVVLNKGRSIIEGSWKVKDKLSTELWLLETAQGLSDEIIECVKQEKLLRPSYQPGPWNVTPAIGLNNCYNYANNRITNTLAQDILTNNMPYCGICG